MKALPPPAETAAASLNPATEGQALERRSGGRATPGKPFGRRTADQAILETTYPAAFVAQAAAASLPAIDPVRPKPAKPYAQEAPTGLVVKTEA